MVGPQSSARRRSSDRIEDEMVSQSLTDSDGMETPEMPTEEVEPEGDEQAALDRAKLLDDGSRLTIEEVRTELGLE